MVSRKSELFTLALKSRLAAIAFQLLTNFLIPDHDAQVFVRPKPNNVSTNYFDSAINVVFGGFERWDAQYFLHIAKHGYSYEPSLAFFPLFPLLVRITSSVLSPILFFLNEDSLLLSAAVCVNVLLFSEAVKCLYELTWRLSKNEEFAYKASLLFCVNPATVFFIAPYTECLFSLLTFKSILWLANGKVAKAVLAIALSTCTRSNGLLNISFLAYYCIKTRHKTWLILIVVCLIPFVSFQLYGYHKFCRDFPNDVPEFIADYASANELVLPGTFSVHNQSWCYSTFPLPYSYIQSAYWNVGFMRYFETKQIPNFLLACPIIGVILLGTLHYFYEHPNHCLNLGIFNFRLIRSERKPYFGEDMFVCVAHAAFLAVFCFFCVHVQVTTRMVFSASPVPYWFVAFCFRHVDADVGGSLVKLFRFTEKHWIAHWYFWGYALLGVALFSNHLPWT